jgi:hypothetical protein
MFFLGAGGGVVGISNLGMLLRRVRSITVFLFFGALGPTMELKAAEGGVLLMLLASDDRMISYLTSTIYKYTCSKSIGS